MAKISGSLIGTKPTGKIGGSLIFQGWKSLHIVRRKVDPMNPNSTKQQTQRSYYSQAVECWRDGSMRAFDKEAWERWLKLTSFKFTNYNRYVKTMIDFLRSGDSNPFIYNFYLIYVTSSLCYLYADSGGGRDDLQCYISLEGAADYTPFAMVWLGSNRYGGNKSGMSVGKTYDFYCATDAGIQLTGFYKYTHTP